LKCLKSLGQKSLHYPYGFLKEAILADFQKVEREKIRRLEEKNQASLKQEL
jgi:hypothetical protein